MAWIVRLMKIGAGGEEQATDVLKIDRPGVLDDVASLGLTSAEAALLLAGVRREIVAAQASDAAVRCPGLFAAVGWPMAVSMRSSRGRC